MLNYKEYLQLIKKVNYLRNEFHLFNNEEISEEALDNLKHKITEFEKSNPTKISPNSPNYVIAGGVAEGFKKFTHLERMLSLTDVFSLQELQDWEEKWENYLDKNYSEKESQKLKNQLEVKYICEPKLDGLAVSLHYQKGDLKIGATRGDGWIGEDITENIKQIQNIPKHILDERYLEIRGEVFLTKSDFEKLNQKIRAGKIIGKLGKIGEEGVFANPRNAASGTLRQLDSSVVGERNLSFVAYDIIIHSDKDVSKLEKVV